MEFPNCGVCIRISSNNTKYTNLFINKINVKIVSTSVLGAFCRVRSNTPLGTLLIQK